MNKQLSYLLNDICINAFGTPVYHPRFWADEREKRPYTTKLTRIQRWNALRHGFNSDKPLVYQFQKNDRSLYLNDIRRRILAERISKKYFYIVHNKIVFHKYFEGLCDLTPRIAILMRGKFFGLSGDDGVLTFDRLISDIEGGACYFLKPHDGGSGRGIFKIEADEKGVLINGSASSISDFRVKLDQLDTYIVEERLSQTGFSNLVFPGTLNTLRVMTMIDPVSGEPFIPVAVHRFGTNQSKYADNWSQGGLSVWIDVGSGVLASGAQYPFGGTVEYLQSHPDSGVKFLGHKLSGWDDVVRAVLRAAKYVPFLPMLGWDIVLTEGRVLVQEANYNPDVNLIQIHRPLLADDRVRQFYEHHRVIRARQ